VGRQDPLATLGYLHFGFPLLRTQIVAKDPLWQNSTILLVLRCATKTVPLIPQRLLSPLTPAPPPRSSAFPALHRPMFTYPQSHLHSANPTLTFCDMIISGALEFQTKSLEVRGSLRSKRAGRSVCDPIQSRLPPHVSLLLFFWDRKALFKFKSSI
jgi:hypothetical protein